MNQLDKEILTSFCDEACDLLARWESVCLELTRNPENIELMQELFRLAHNLKGGSKAVGLNEYGNFVHKVEDGITLVRDGLVSASDQVQSLFLGAQKILLDWSEGLKLQETFVPVGVESFLSGYQQAFKKSETETSKNIENKLEEKVEFQAKSECTEPKLDTEPMVPKKQIEQRLPREKTKTLVKSSQANQNETIRISAQKLENLIQAIGELSIHQSIVWHTKDEKYSDNRIFLNSLQLSQKLTKELYDKALSLRMQPLASVFQRLERTVIDLSKTLEKPIDVHIVGGDVELDKIVIEKIVDPFLHIVRNAVDHGIEQPADRIISGKSETGLISISAYQDTFGVMIRIQDDGKGLSSERILAKALEKNLVDKTQVKSREDIFKLIFLPGFSTSEKITDVSGRGVGMNVVSTALEELQGQIKIESEEEKGTTFLITLPTSMSIIEAMLVSLSGQVYVVPVGAVEEVINLKDLNYSKGQTMFQLREHVVPVQELSDILINSRKKNEVCDEGRSLLITRNGSDRIGFVVDKVIGQQQIVIRPLNDMINGAYGLLGGTILGNGEPGLILDIPQITNDYLSKNKMTEGAA